MYLDQRAISLIKANYPTYKAASQKTRVPWQMIAAVHYRENSLQAASPGPGGPYQNDPPLSDKSVGELCKYYDLPFKRPEEDFLIASVICGHWLQHKANHLLTLDENNLYQIADAFWGYNGRAYGSFIKSPYVCNFLKDRKLRIRGSYIDKNGQRQQVDVADSRPGALLIFIELIQLFPSRELNLSDLLKQFNRLP